MEQQDIKKYLNNFVIYMENKSGLIFIENLVLVVC